MKLLITGSSGLIGSALMSFMTAAGHDVRRLVRSLPSDGDLLWSPQDGLIDLNRLGEIDAVVHLAGENIATGRWTAAKKARITDSRVKGTDLLAKALAKLEYKPKVLVCASGIGFYGHRGDEIVDETSPVGEGFLAGLACQWEQASQPASRAGIRVVNIRTGMVLSASGGALKKMLLPFKMGLGGVIGSGKQYISWVGIDELVRMIHHVIDTESICGPVNLVSPNPVTNYQFTKTLGRVLHRPTIVPMPAFAARIAFGEMANELLLASTRVDPKVLTASGYSFEYPDLETALRDILTH